MRSLKIFFSSMLIVLLVAHTMSMAQENSGQSTISYVPRLSDLMVLIQVSTPSFSIRQAPELAFGSV